MRKTKAHDILKALEHSGVRHVFGIPGTHNIEFFDAFADFPQLEPVLITDEQSSGFIGDGYARSSGRIAALALVPGAGLTHALSGIAEAYLDQVPLLVLAFGIRTDTDRKYQLHDINQLEIARPVVKEALRISDWSKVGEVIEHAIRVSTRAPYGPVVVEVPAEGMLLTNPISRPQAPFSLEPQLKTANESIDKALKLISSSNRIGLYVGNIGGDEQERENLVAFADKVDAAVWSTITAKGLYPENHTRFLWNTLSSASPPEYERLEKEIDLWIALGGRFGEVSTASYGFNPSAPIVHVDLDAAVLGANLKEELSVQMDAHLFVHALLQKIKKKETQIQLNEIKEAHVLRAKREQQESSALTKTNPERIYPAELFRALQNTFPADTVYALDSGNGLFLGMEQLRLSEARCFLGPTDFSCMGYSVPAAIGAKIADPKRTVVALPGDGAFLMTGLELLSAKKSGRTPLVFVLKDGTLSQIAQFQNASVVRETLVDLPEYDLKGIAMAVGATFCRLTSGGLESQLKEIHSRSERGEFLMVEVPIDYSQSTYFTGGVLRNNFKRYPLMEKVSLAGRLIGRKAVSWIQ